MAQPLRELPAREASALRRELCGAFAISPATLSRWLRQIGIRERTRGEVRHGYATHEEMLAVLAIQWSSYSQDRGLLMGDEAAMEIAVENGKLRPDVLSLASYRSWKRARGVNQSAGLDYDGFGQVANDACVELRSLGPNHVWQADFSLARNWLVSNNKQLVFDETAYKGKDLAIDSLRVIRFGIVDHTSGSMFFRYFLGRGESTPIFLEGLYEAMAEKRLSSGELIGDKMPFGGVPEILQIDRGSFGKTKATKEVVERLGVTLIISQSARAKGAIETAMNFWERQFECSFRLQPFNSVEELNDQALHRAALINAERPFARHGSTRRAFWLRHLNANEHSMLRKLTCDLAQFKAIALSEPERRRVTAELTISYKGQTYRVPEALRYEKQVELMFSVFDFPRIQLRACDRVGAERYHADPIARDAAGFPLDAPVIGSEFQGRKKSREQSVVQEAKAVANGWAPGEIVARGRDLKKVASTAMKPRSEGVEIEAGPAVTFRKADARHQVRQAMQRDFSAAEKAYMAAWPEEVSQDQIDAAVVEFERGLTARVITFGRKA
jgi:hypothetical protein